MIAVIDYNMGNVRSVANAFESLGCEVEITNQRAVLEKADHIILPGVGAFGEGMNHLKELGLIGVLRDEVLKKKKPFLGICLGMQLLADEGFEFGHPGLGWISGSAKKLEPGDLALPHVGWNNFKVTQNCRILDRIGGGADFYYVHSYYFAASRKENVNAVCEYGQDFPAVISQENIYGVQFHPEKSQKAGKILLENFVKLTAQLSSRA